MGASRIAIAAWGTGLCLVVSGLAAWSLTLDARSASYQLAADHVEFGDTIPPPVLARLAQTSFDERQAWTCRPDIVKAAFTLTLANIDQQDSGDRAGWTGALQAADQILIRALSCNPADGNGWARLAMVEATLGAPARRVGRSLQLSAWLAPIEPGAPSGPTGPSTRARKLSQPSIKMCWLLQRGWLRTMRQHC